MIDLEAQHRAVAQAGFGDARIGGGAQDQRRVVDTDRQIAI
jgi:hypothetical protein